jgi:hypothetical protein
VGLAGILSSGALGKTELSTGTLSGRLDGLGRVDLRTLLSGSGAFDWGWNHLGCCLSRTGLESLGLLSFSDCLGRHTDRLLFHLMAPIHWRALKGSTKLAGRETVDRGVSVQLSKRSGICLFS